MDDKKGTQAMTTPELTRYVYEDGCYQASINGQMCRFADVEAYTQAAIAAAMMGAVKPLEWDGEDGNGFGPALPDGLSYFVIDESGEGDYSWELIAYGRTLEDSGGVTWLTIGEARDGASRHYVRSVLDALPIPTDTMAALEAVKAQVRLGVIKEVLAAIYEGKRKQGLLDIRFNFASDTSWDAYFEEVFKMEMAVLAGNTSPLDFGDLTLTDDQIRAMEGSE